MNVSDQILPAIISGIVWAIFSGLFYYFYKLIYYVAQAPTLIKVIFWLVTLPITVVHFMFVYSVSDGTLTNAFQLYLLTGAFGVIAFTAYAYNQAKKRKS